MPKENKNRILYILNYIWKNTDSEHYVTINEIHGYLSEKGISATRKTNASDIIELTEYGFKIELEHSTQNRYRFEQRRFELPEVKMLVDAIQASRFISKKTSKRIVEKLASLTSVYQSDELVRNLYIDKRIKNEREGIQYAVDTVYRAINLKRKIRFRYYYYTSEKNRELKHEGKIYTLSPYDMYWNDDSYYVIGHCEKRGILKFRVDRMCNPDITNEKITPKLKGYSIEKYSKSVFSMYDGTPYTVELECNNDLMNTIIDRFGTGVKTQIADNKHFIATVNISASPTFYGWLFTFADGIKVLAPSEVVTKYRALAQSVINSAFTPNQ